MKDLAKKKSPKENSSKLEYTLQQPGEVLELAGERGQRTLLEMTRQKKDLTRHKICPDRPLYLPRELLYIRLSILGRTGGLLTPLSNW